MKPYVYIIKSLKENKYYIGSRCISKSEPCNDILVNYFTSSFTVKNLIDMHGKEDFVVYSIKTFDDVETCISYEDFLLRSIPPEKRKHFLNLNFTAGGAVIKSQTHTFITNGLIYKQYPRNLELPDGWWKESKHTPPKISEYKKYYSKDGKYKFYKKDTQPEDLMDTNEYRKWSSPPPKIHWVTDGEINIRVSDYTILSKGWKYGKTTKSGWKVKNKNPNHRPTKGRIWINNGVDSAMVYPDDLIQEGWVKGYLKTDKRNEARKNQIGKKRSPYNLKKNINENQNTQS